MFETVLRMSFSATLIIVVLLVSRPLLKRLSGGLRAALWVMVAIRLLCPVFVESPFSLIPNSLVTESQSANSDTVPHDETPEYTPPAADVGEADPDTLVGITPPAVNTVVPDSTVKPSPSLPDVDSGRVKENNKTFSIAPINTIWLAGIGVMAAYFVFEYLRLKRRVSANIAAEDGIRICDDINTAFIVGIIRPIIYLPSNLDDRYRDAIILHEKMHISRRDHLQKIFGYMVLAFHWFNPFVWIAYILFCKDIELACDEKVIKGKSDVYKKQYATAILYGCSARGGISPCHVAFGEIGASQRIKNVLKYKKAKLWLVVIGVTVAVVIGVCFLTNPNSDENSVGDDNSGESSLEDSFSDTSEDILSADSEEESGESSMATEDESTTIPEDESSVATENESSVAPDDESSVDTEDESTTIPEDESSVAPDDESSVATEDNSTEEVESKPVEWYSIQKSHETPENVIFKDGFSPSTETNRGAVYVRILKYCYNGKFSETSAFKEQPIKVWLCDKYGNKIDYVYSNSHGMAVFQVFKGEYTIVAEGVEGYIMVFPTRYANFFGAGGHSYVEAYLMSEISLYDVETYRTITVTVIDAVTGEPVPSATAPYCPSYRYNDNLGGLEVVIGSSETRKLTIQAEGYADGYFYASEDSDSYAVELKPLE